MRRTDLRITQKEIEAFELIEEARAAQGNRDAVAILEEVGLVRPFTVIDWSDIDGMCEEPVLFWEMIEERWDILVTIMVLLFAPRRDLRFSLVERLRRLAP